MFIICACLYVSVCTRLHIHNNSCKARCRQCKYANMQICIAAAMVFPANLIFLCSEPRSTAPPGPDSYTGWQEYLSRNKVFSRSRYHDELLVLTLDHISLEYRDSVYINLLTYISFHSQPCNQNRFHHMSSQDNIFRLFIFAFQPICETNLSICSFCLGH